MYPSFENSTTRIAILDNSFSNILQALSLYFNQICCQYPLMNYLSNSAGFWGYNEFCEKMLTEMSQWTIVWVRTSIIEFFRLYKFKNCAPIAFTKCLESTDNYRTRAIISRGLYFFYPFFTEAAVYNAERSLFLILFPTLNCTLNPFFILFFLTEKKVS